jgi:hypothetical protein
MWYHPKPVSVPTKEKTQPRAEKIEAVQGKERKGNMV